MRGQVTIFAVLGVSLVIVLVFSFAAIDDIRSLFSRAQKEKFISIDYTEGILRSTVDECLRHIAGETLKQQGLHAGYLSAYPNATYGEEGAASWMPYGSDMIPVLLDGNVKAGLSEDEIGLRACRKPIVDLEQCIKAADYEAEGYSLELPAFNGNFSRIDDSCEHFLKDGSTLLKITYPIRLSQGKLTVEASEFIVEKPYQIKLMYASALAFADKIMQESQAGTYNLTGGCAPGYKTVLDDSSGIFSMVDGTGPEPYTFRFAVSGYTFEGNCN